MIKLKDILKEASTSESFSQMKNLMSNGIPMIFPREEGELQKKYYDKVMNNGDVGVFIQALSVGDLTPSGTTGRIDAANDVVAYSSSDIRFKKNTTPIQDSLFKIKQLQGVEFDWIPNEEHHGYEGHDVGVIAQEVEKVLPEVVTTRDSGYKAVKYEKMIPLLIEGIKEQQEQIDELKKEVEELKNA